MQDKQEESSAVLKKIKRNLPWIKDTVFLIVLAVLLLDIFKIVDFSSVITGREQKKIESKLFQLNSFTNQYIDFQTLSDNKALNAAYMVYDYEGVIKKINLKGGLRPDSGLPYKVSIVLSVGSGKDTVSTYYTKDDESLIKVFKKNSEGNVPINLSDLKEGDKIVISNNVSLRRDYPKPLNSATIIKM